MSHYQVWNIDPITRGLKPQGSQASALDPRRYWLTRLESEHLTRLLGD